ncbi:hypothetical protein LU276_05915 [Moraxella haemolytica]|uniref:hypothetical protein n=1 Tax=Moraxella haemolytica TaxID=2904119 RepID=UPI002543BD85|nr:hypothetical protein [Moraxella sp. ZY171148]WII94567.1 hypothetical protein LU276_05915 [Moraxella sp. ZY171148]
MQKSVIYIVRVQKFGIYKEFSDFDTAHTFATQLAQDYPTAHIDRYKLTQTFDSWEGVQ